MNHTCNKWCRSDFTPALLCTRVTRMNPFWPWPRLSRCTICSDHRCQRHLIFVVPWSILHQRSHGIHKLWFSSQPWSVILRHDPAVRGPGPLAVWGDFTEWTNWEAPAPVECSWGPPPPLHLSPDPLQFSRRSGLGQTFFCPLAPFAHTLGYVALLCQM